MALFWNYFHSSPIIVLNQCDSPSAGESNNAKFNSTAFKQFSIQLARRCRFVGGGRWGLILCTTWHEGDPVDFIKMILVQEGTGVNGGERGRVFPIDPDESAGQTALNFSLPLLFRFPCHVDTINCNAPSMRRQAELLALVGNPYTDLYRFISFDLTFNNIDFSRRRIQAAPCGGQSLDNILLLLLLLLRSGSGD